jgi:hypothetical protein
MVHDLFSYPALTKWLHVGTLGQRYEAEESLAHQEVLLFLVSSLEAAARGTRQPQPLPFLVLNDGKAPCVPHVMFSVH